MKNNNFIQHSIIEALAFLKELIFAEELAMRGGFLQSLDPRFKAVTFLLIIIQLLFTRNIFILFFFYALCLLLVLISKINLGFFLKRTWIFIPLFSLFIAIPAFFINFSAALIFVTRVLICVSYAVLLSITTKHFELLKVLRIFKIPQIFVMILGMCYRYIYLFVEIIEHTYLAVRSRVGKVVNYKFGQNIVAWNVVSLWNRSVKLNEEVYGAMLSRGFRGEAVAWNDFKIKGRDWLWLVTVLIIIIVAARQW
ncbi:MAG: energy-coupling factor transporter transmembrane component T [Candidatus Omnitrophica bacterium]|nr:energy-coupling factor transporter transmembrane component T [Candidatus Omnitrophota bacterium]